MTQLVVWPGDLAWHTHDRDGSNSGSTGWPAADVDMELLLRGLERRKVSLPNVASSAWSLLTKAESICLASWP